MKHEIIKYFIDRPNIIKIFYIIFNLLFVNNVFMIININTKIFLQKKVHHPKQPNFIIKISLKRTKLNIIISKFFTKLQLKSWAFVFFLSAWSCAHAIFLWGYKLKRVNTNLMTKCNLKHEKSFWLMKDKFFDLLKVLNLTHTSFGVIVVGEAWLIYAICFWFLLNL
jgi:hypothetical protein